MVTLKYKKLLAFSLVELMISLITISCIAAAFTPVITKKLKKQDIALSIAQTSEIMSPCEDNQYYTSQCKLCTQKYCIQCPLENCTNETQYVDTSYCGCKECLTNRNVVPNENCEECKKCISCTKDACIKCQSGYYLKGLDGKNHKTCQKCGKTSGRDNYCFDGINEESPDFCDNPPDGFFCKGSELKQCSLEYQTMCTKCNNNNCTGCAGYYYLDNNNTCQRCGGNCHTCNRNNKDDCLSCSAIPLSIVNGVGNCNTGCGIENCKWCTGTIINGDTSNVKCTVCWGGYSLSNDGKSCTACSSIANCISCVDGGKCTKCIKGMYADSSGVCKTCNVENCAQCGTDGRCLACIQNYHLHNSQCVSDDGKFNCSDYSFMRIGNLCVTRRNMGDSNLLSIPSSVTVVNAASEYCYSRTAKCCWKGETATSCDSENGDYSGCNRTMCNWDAANEICKNFNYAGKTWRLPTPAEMSNWTVNSILLENNGLMLCDLSSGYNSSKCAMENRCYGAQSAGSTYTGGYCEPYNVWATESSKTAASQCLLYAGAWQCGSYSKPFAFSVRCVTEMNE